MQHSSTLLNVFTQLLSYSTPVMLMTVRERLEYQPSHTQPRLCSATEALVTWNSWVRLLCPASVFPTRNRSCRATYRTEHPIPALITVHRLSCCACTLSLGALSLFPSWAPPCTRSHMGRRQGRGKKWWVWVSVSVLMLLLFPLSLFLTSFSPVFVLVILFFFLASPPCRVAVTLVSALPGRSRPPQTSGPKRKGGMWAVGRSPVNCARGPAERCKATLWFSPLSFPFPLQVIVIKQKSEHFAHSFLFFYNGYSIFSNYWFIWHWLTKCKALVHNCVEYAWLLSGIKLDANIDS